MTLYSNIDEVKTLEVYRSKTAKANIKALGTCWAIIIFNLTLQVRKIKARASPGPLFRGKKTRIVNIT